MDEWTKYTIDLSNYRGRAVALSFLFGTDPGLELEGWYIDDVQIWRNVACYNVENSTLDPKIECKTNKDVIHTGEFLEGLVYSDNPGTKTIDVNVYMAILVGQHVVFYNGTDFVSQPEPFSKELPAGSQIGESVFMFPIMTPDLRGSFILAAAMTKPASLELYGDIATFPFKVE